MLVVTWRQERLKFIPVRGRKPVNCYFDSLNIVVEIYPREGTEMINQ